MKARLKQFAVLVFGLFSLQSYGQQVAFHGSAREDVARSVYQFENRFYITGTTRANHKSSTNYYVLELYPNGSLKNEFSFGNLHYDTGFDIIADESGIYVLGQSWDGGYGNNDMFLHKLNFEGEKKWSRFYGGDHNEIGHKFIKTNDGGFALAGHNRSLNDFGDMYLVKTNNEGEITWENHFGERYVDHAFALAENLLGEIVVAGTWGGFFVANCCDFQNPDADIFIVKTNARGEKIWEKRFGGPAHDWAKDIVAAPGGGYLVCGSTQSQGAGSFDVFLMKIDEDGNQLWFKTYGGSDFEYGESLGINLEQNIYLLGSSASFSENSKPDHYLVKTDLNGEIIWEKTFGGTGSDYSSALVCTNDSGCVFTGTTTAGILGGKDIVFYRISKKGESLVVSAIPPVNNSFELVSVFPNPVEKEFTVHIVSEAKNDFHFVLFNSTGQRVYEKNIIPNVNSVHRPELLKGFYFYTVQQNNNTVFKGKLLVN